MRDTYNGWANRETWLAYTWLTNDEHNYNAIREILKAEPDDYEAKQELESYIEQERTLYKEMEASLFDDLLSSALAQIDLDEIVEAFRDN